MTSWGGGGVEVGRGRMLQGELGRVGMKDRKYTYTYYVIHGAIACSFFLFFFH